MFFSMFPVPALATKYRLHFLPFLHFPRPTSTDVRVNANLISPFQVNGTNTDLIDQQF